MPWIINAEIYPSHVREAGNAAATAANWVCALAVSLTFLTLTEKVTRGGAFWLYSACATLGLGFTYALVPETRGKSLEDIAREFEPRRKGRPDEGVN